LVIAPTEVAAGLRIAKRLALAAACTLTMVVALAAGSDAPSAQQLPLPIYPTVTPDYRLRFPQDYGSHPQFRTEWWYVTGWLKTAQGTPLGFQVTFFRSRPPQQQDNPSAFAARQLLIAHVAISDPAHAQLWQDQRIRRAGLGLAEAQPDNTNVWVDDWTLHRDGDRYTAAITAEGFALHLQFAATQLPLLNGDDGYSRKGPRPESASYYYSEPHLAVSGTVQRAANTDAVTGEAWLDHEWSSQYLDPEAEGWDWLGVNLADGGALMAFEIRNHQGHPLWLGATVREAGGGVQVFAAGQIDFRPGRRWRSSRSGISYPVNWQVRVGARVFEIEPLMDDQENDSRLSSGTIYWEGAVRVFEQHHSVGSGYLELTGYGGSLAL
jgi:predicted secreted hydrolase